MPTSKLWSSSQLVFRSLRVPIAAMVALSSLCGYVLYPTDKPRVIALFLVAGIFALASGATFFNQVQESTSDALMIRTRCRPLASGRLTRRQGTIVSLVLIMGGLILLTLIGNTAVPALGILCIFLYNVVYTLLKPRSTWALLPGGVCGAIPPLMGWLAADGGLPDYRIGLFMAVLFLWQVPHFWFLSASHRDDYHRAGLPLILDQLQSHQFRRVALVWLFAFAGGIALLAVFQTVENVWSRLGLFAVACFGCFPGAKILFYSAEHPGLFRNIFLYLNIMMGAVFFLILLNAL